MLRACLLTCLVTLVVSHPQYGPEQNTGVGIDYWWYKEGTFYNIDSYKEPLANQYETCDTYSDCVPLNQCKNGVIDTSGAGSFDLRISQKKLAEQKGYLVCDLEGNIAFVCCKIPTDDYVDQGSIINSGGNHGSQGGYDDQTVGGGIQQGGVGSGGFVDQTVGGGIQQGGAVSGGYVDQTVGGPPYPSCSAGLKCVETSTCNLYTGFLGANIPVYEGQPFIEYQRCTTEYLPEGVCCQAAPVKVVDGGDYGDQTVGVGVGGDGYVDPNGGISVGGGVGGGHIGGGSVGGGGHIGGGSVGGGGGHIGGGSVGGGGGHIGGGSVGGGGGHIGGGSVGGGGGGHIGGGSVGGGGHIGGGSVGGGGHIGGGSVGGGGHIGGGSVGGGGHIGGGSVGGGSIGGGDYQGGAVGGHGGSGSVGGGHGGSGSVGGGHGGSGSVGGGSIGAVGGSQHNAVGGGYGNQNLASPQCGVHEECVLKEYCSKGFINTDGSGLLDLRNPYTYNKCIDPEYPSGAAVCCRIDTSPIPVKACPNHEVCTDYQFCNPEGYVSTDPFSTQYSTGTECYKKPGFSALTGVCCQPSCPADSVCIPETLCFGDIQDSSGNFGAYSPGGSWAKCGLAGQTEAGICCRNPVPGVPTPSKCGVSQYAQNNALKTRYKTPTITKLEADFGEFPWQAIVFYSNYTFKCGATIVGDQHLLTAAHCVRGGQPYDFRIRVGEWQVNTFTEAYPYHDYDVAEITYHPDYKKGPEHNNIAIIKLAAPMTLAYNVNKACLPVDNYAFPPNTRCFVSGWGKDSFVGNYQHILKKIDVPLIENPYCQTLLRKTRLGRYFRLHSGFICAGGEEGKDACTGDGGGPLVCLNADDQYVLVGITSWGVGCGVKDVPGVYSNVAKYVPWILDVINGINSGPGPY